MVVVVNGGVVNGGVVNGGGVNGGGCFGVVNGGGVKDVKEEKARRCLCSHSETKREYTVSSVITVQFIHI